MYLPDSDSPYSGEVFTNYSTGEKEYQGTYENGLLVQYSYLNKDGSVKEPINGETLIDRGGLLYEVNGQKPYTGDVFELYKDGGRKYTGSLKDGKEDGLWTSWYENGQKSEEGTYKDGKEDGLWTSWYENGQKSEEGTYKDGKEDGLWTSWYENGQKRGEWTYKDGKKEGFVTMMVTANVRAQLDPCG
jgi:antitoxin component YwqK of YwqJK toxin-antitoxin module